MGKQAGSALIGTVFTLFMFCVRSRPYSAAQKSRVRAAAVVFLLLSAVLLLWRNPLLGVCVLAGCGLHLIYFYHMIQKQFGGITGDLAGYLVQMTELLILLVSVLYMLVGNIVK